MSDGPGDNVVVLRTGRTPTVHVLGTPNHLEGASSILATTTTSHGLEGR